MNVNILNHAAKLYISNTEYAVSRSMTPKREMKNVVMTSKHAQCRKPYTYAITVHLALITEKIIYVRHEAQMALLLLLFMFSING